MKLYTEQGHTVEIKFHLERISVKVHGLKHNCQKETLLSMGQVALGNTDIMQKTIDSSVKALDKMEKKIEAE